MNYQTIRDKKNVTHSRAYQRGKACVKWK
jgi:hypothetical protein